MQFAIHTLAVSFGSLLAHHQCRGFYGVTCSTTEPRSLEGGSPGRSNAASDSSLRFASQGILNLFGGVLIQKKKAEEALEDSGMQYTIVRCALLHFRPGCLIELAGRLGMVKTLCQGFTGLPCCSMQHYPTQPERAWGCCVLISNRCPSQLHCRAGQEAWSGQVTTTRRLTT